MRNPLPEQRESPPEFESNPQITRPDYEYSTPERRKIVALEAIVGLSEVALSLRFLDVSDPEDMDNFVEGGGEIIREFNSFAALKKIDRLIKEYLKDKVEPFLTIGASDGRS